MIRLIRQAGIILALFLFISTHVQAQEEIDEFLRESVEDGEKLIGAYLTPFMNSVSSGLNQGWYNTAKPHKVAGVDLTVTVNAMNIPNDEMFYNVAKLNLKEIELSPTSPDYDGFTQNAPTIIGPDRAPVFRLKDDPSQTFKGPAGFDLKGNIGANKIPVPLYNFGFGLPKGFDIKLRFLPQMSLGEDAKFTFYGIGVMHDVKQWIPGMKTLPFDLSAFAGYTRLRIEAAFPNDAYRKNSGGELQMNALTLQGLISKKISVLTVYGGLGYNMAQSKLAMLGQYDINQDGDFSDTREVNPLKLDFSASGPRATAGFRLKLAVITLHADYTLQKYNALSVGFGINVR
jgi:hypothetical protein